MFLQLRHTGLDVFKFSHELVLECYKLTKFFPESERFGIVSQIRRAALSVHLNVAEGCSRKPGNDRKRFYESPADGPLKLILPLAWHSNCHM